MKLTIEAVLKGDRSMVGSLSRAIPSAPGFRFGLAPGAFYYRRKSLGDDLGVEPERPAIDIPEVEPHPFLEIDIVPTVHLPETGEPRLDRELSMLPGFEPAYFIG